MGNKLIVANLKMGMELNDIINYLNIINNNINSNNVIICPTSIFIPYFLSHNYQVGIQNVFYESKGAYTGEVSPSQAFSIGINYAIVGHGERRYGFKENDEIISKKVKACLNNHLKVILCVGENQNIDKLAKNDILEKQLISALNGISIAEFKNIVIVYEPLWAIGTNVIPHPDEIKKVIAYIKSIIRLKFNYNDCKVLYGGSINEFNINEISHIENIDGFLIGDATINPNKFLNIIKVIQNG